MDDVLNWLWQGAVVAAALSVMLTTLRRARANVRYVVCGVAALVVVGLPVLPALRPAVSVGLVSLRSSDPLVALPDTWWTSAAVILAAVALWGGVHLLRLLSAIVAVRRVRHESQPFPAHVEAALPHWLGVRAQGRRATLVVSDAVASAAVLGWGTPMIAVAPSLVHALDREDLDRVLVHEWAHVQRRDDLANVVQVAVRALAGWHPALWWIDRRLHVEREIACDETVVAMTGSPKSYADCLMKLSGMATTPRALQMTPAIFARAGLRARIVKIVSRDQPIARIWGRALAAAVVVTLCVLSVAVRGVTLVETTIFATDLPVVTAFAPGLLRARPMVIAAVPTQGDSAKQAPPRVAATSPSPQPAPVVRSAQSPPPAQEPAAVPEPREPQTADVPGRGVAAQAKDVGAPAPAPTVGPSDAPAQPVAGSTPLAAEPRSPWGTAAAGGVAIGRTSKDAGVATAGFFTRAARRVAGSF